MAVQVHVPEWVTPTERQVTDVLGMCRAAGPSMRVDGIIAAVEWAVSATCPDAAGAVTRASALSRQGTDKEYARGAADTLLWLAGRLTMPPVKIPRRRADGEVMTLDDLLGEARAGSRWQYLLPEQRAAERSKLAHQVVLWQAWADLIDGQAS